MKLTRKIVIAVIIGLALLFAASALSATAHTGAMPHPTAVEY
jgi:hypothetical protein